MGCDWPTPLASSGTATSHLQEGISKFERSLEVALDVDELQRATALRHLGTLLETRRDVDGARARFEEALATYRRRGDREGEAKCLNSLGVVARTAGDLPGAEAYFVESLALRRELGDVPGTANRLSNLALVLIDRGEIARALDLLTEAAVPSTGRPATSGRSPAARTTSASPTCSTVIPRSASRSSPTRCAASSSSAMTTVSPRASKRSPVSPPPSATS